MREREREKPEQQSGGGGAHSGQHACRPRERVSGSQSTGITALCLLLTSTGVSTQMRYISTTVYTKVATNNPNKNTFYTILMYYFP